MTYEERLAALDIHRDIAGVYWAHVRRPGVPSGPTDEELAWLAEPAANRPHPRARRIVRPC